MIMGDLTIKRESLNLRKDYHTYIDIHKIFCTIFHYDTLKDDLLTLDEAIVGRIFHT
jgi:hypothetical protein